MSHQVEAECPETCPLRGLTHQHVQKVANEKTLKHKRFKHRRELEGEWNFPKTEQKRVVKRKR